MAGCNRALQRWICGLSLATSVIVLAACGGGGSSTALESSGPDTGAQDGSAGDVVISRGSCGAGLKSGFDANVIPSVAYTDPEVAWVGVTETEAKERGLDYGIGTFPWAASGRSLGLGRDEGLTKLLFDNETKRVVGAGIVGPSAGDLIAEVALAIEMGSDAEDIGLTIHPHPTLSETVAFSAEAYAGTITDLYIPKRN